MAKTKSQTQDDYVLIKVDRRTANLLKQLSVGANTTVLEVTRVLTWLGAKAFGRKVQVEDQQKVMEVSLEDYQKVSAIERE